MAFQETPEAKTLAAHAGGVARPTLSGHLQIMRFDHWMKNVFVLPGIVVAFALAPRPLSWIVVYNFIMGLLATGIIASSNYVINEIIDAPFDRHHPQKSSRPVPSGRVSIPIALAQWILLFIGGLLVASTVSIPFAATMAAFWLMGIVYNIPPIRAKDVAYLDVLAEAANNPIRLLAGWYIVGPQAIPPASLLLSYWMIGAYFMALKRRAEYRELCKAGTAADYRRSFAIYNEERLLSSILFYGSAAMLFLGAFTMRFRLELILSYPVIALTMAVYFSLSAKDDSPVQNPEKLYREPALMAAVIVSALLIGVLLLLDIPLLHELTEPTVPTISETAPDH